MNKKIKYFLFSFLGHPFWSFQKATEKPLSFNIKEIYIYDYDYANQANKCSRDNAAFGATSEQHQF